MLNLIEDEITLFKHFENCLTKTKVLDWKYEGAESQLLDSGSHSTVEKLLIYKNLVQYTDPFNQAES